MKYASYLLFYGYVLTLLLAGGWGAFGGAALDHRLLFDLDVRQLPPATSASLLSQYRFLRLIEVGFGLFALVFVREIYQQPKFNMLFLSVMAAGVLARALSWQVDGPPKPVFGFFLVYELVGVVVLFLYTRRTLVRP
jgi:hypothetical protein